MNKSSLRILIIASEFPPDAGGIGNHAYNLAQHLSSYFKVSVVADIVNASKEEVEKSAAAFRFKFYPLHRTTPTIFTYLKRINFSFRLAKNNDVIISSGKFSLWLINVLKPFYPSKKFIVVVHGTELLLKNKIAGIITFGALQKANSIIAVSNFTKNLLPQTIIKTKPVAVIHNGIDNNEFIYKAPSATKHFTSNSIINLITIGSVTERKGQQNVIQALPVIIKRYPKLHYHVAGKPTAYNKSKQLTEALCVAEHVTFYGAVSRKKLIEILEASDIKIMLSSNTNARDVEGFGIAVLEANALGKPAIGSFGNGLEEAVENNITGKLVDANNPSEVMIAIEEILDSYNFYAANALRWAKQHDWQILIQQYIDVINATMAEKT